MGSKEGLLTAWLVALEHLGQHAGQPMGALSPQAMLYWIMLLLQQEINDGMDFKVMKVIQQ